MGLTNLYKNFFGEHGRGLSNFYNTYVKHNSVSTSKDGGLGGLACRVIWALNFTSYEYTPSNLVDGNINTSKSEAEKNTFLDNMSKITRWISENSMFKHMEGLCCRIDMPNFSITQQVDNTKGKITIDNREGVYQTVGGSPIWGDRDTIKLTFYETQIPLIEEYIWPWMKSCKYSFITNKDIYSIPRANLHISFYPDDKDTYIAFKYIVYGLYPVSIESIQPNHEKKTSIDKRGVTFAYNNITITFDTGFTSTFSDSWNESTVGTGYGVTSNTAGKMAPKLNGGNNNLKDTTKDLKNTKINNKSITDKEKKDREKLFNTIKLNGLDLNGSDKINLRDTTEDISAPILNGGNDLLNSANIETGEINNVDDIYKKRNLLNGGNDELIDTTKDLNFPILNGGNKGTQYIKNRNEYGIGSTNLTNKNNLLNGGEDNLIDTTKELKTSKLSNNLNQQILNADKSISLDEALLENANNENGSGGKSDRENSAINQAKNDAILNNNLNSMKSDNLLNKYKLINQAKNDTVADKSFNSNIGIKNKNQQLANGQVRAYSVAKDLKEDELNGWGKSGGGDYVNTNIPNNQIISQINNIVNNQENNIENKLSISNIESRANIITNQNQYNIREKSDGDIINQSIISSQQNDQIIQKSLNSNNINQDLVNQIKNVSDNKNNKNNIIIDKQSIDNKIATFFPHDDNLTQSVTNDNISEKMNKSDLSISLDEAIEIYEEQQSQNSIEKD